MAGCTTCEIVARVAFIKYKPEWFILNKVVSATKI